MHFLRCLFFIRARFHLDVWAVHVPGMQNGLADTLSRNNILPADTRGYSSSKSHTSRATRATDRPANGTDISSLEPAIRELFFSGIAPSTKRNYQSGSRHYTVFCEWFNFHPHFPVSERGLMAFVAFLHREGLSSSTVKNYLAAVRHSQISLSMGDPNIGEMPCLDYIVKGLKRLASTPQRPRLPITPEILEQLKRV